MKNNPRQKILVIASLIFIFTYSFSLAQESEPRKSFSSSDISKVAQNSPRPAFVPGHLIVKLKDAKYKSGVLRVNQKYKILAQEKLFKSAPGRNQKKASKSHNTAISKLDNIYLVKVSENTDILQMAAEYAKDSSVEYAEPDYIIYLDEAKSTPHERWYWQLDKGSQEYLTYQTAIKAEKKTPPASPLSSQETTSAVPKEQAPVINDIVVNRNPTLPIPVSLPLDYPKVINTVIYAESPEVVAANDIIKDLPNDLYVNPTGDGSTWSLNNYWYRFSPRPEQDMWGLKIIEADKAWKENFARSFESAGEGVIVAVVDTGVDYAHPDLAENIWRNTGEIADNLIDDDENGLIDDVQGWDFVYNDNNPSDVYGHGTHVAGTIAAVGNNNIGIIGVAPKAKIMAVKGINDGGGGPVSALADAIYYAAENGAKVINCSWGMIGYSQALKDIFYYAYYDKNCIFVVSAGNDNRNAANQAPANLSCVITVAASTQPRLNSHYRLEEQRCFFSSYGSKIDVSAPGGDHLFSNILSTVPPNSTIKREGVFPSPNYEVLAGTSMASPHVAGLAALLLSAHPEYSTEIIRQAIRISADDLGKEGFDNDFGHGRINARRAVGTSTFCAAKIFSPEEYDSLRAEGDKVAIKGVAYGNYGIWEYTLAYKKEADPDDSWHTFWRSSDEARDIASELGKWDTRGLANGGYILRLEVEDIFNYYKFSDYVTVYLNRNMKGDFIFRTGGQIFSSPAIGDLEGDGQKELVVTSSDGGVYVLNYVTDYLPAGELLSKPGWPIWTNDDVVGGRSPTIADLDGNGDLEVIVCGSKRVYVYKSDGTLLNNHWPKELQNEFSAGAMYNYESSFSAPVISDVNNDGKLEIVVMQPNGEVAVLDKDANLLSGWSHNRAGCSSWLTPAVGSIGNHKVIVLPNESKKIYLYNPEDRESYFVQDLVEGSNSPVLVDLNRLADIEIITAGQSKDDRDPIKIYVHEPNGARYGNWPQTLDAGGYSPQFALADLDQDGYAEVIVTVETNSSNENSIYVFKQGGNLLWKTGKLERFKAIRNSSPLAADVNNDGNPEVIVAVGGSDNGEILVFDKEGKKLDNYCISIGDAIRSTPAIADLDDDGRLDIAITTRAGRVFVFSWGDEAGIGRSPWPFFHGNVEHTGWFYHRPPVTTVQGVDNNWHNEPVTVTLRASPGNAEIDSTIYYLDNPNALNIYTAPLSINTSGEHTLGYYTVDRLGYQEAVKTASIKIDLTIPDAPLFDQGECYIRADGNFAAKWSAANNVGISGLTTYRFSIGSQRGLQDIYAEDGSSGRIMFSPFLFRQGRAQFLPDTTYYLAVKTINNAGSESETTYLEVRISDDATPPVTRITVTPTIPLSGIYASNVEIELVASDNQSGVASIYYGIDLPDPTNNTHGRLWELCQKYTGKFTITNEGNHTVTYYAKDRNGNYEETKLKYIEIDKTAPTGNFVAERMSQYITIPDVTLYIRTTTHANYIKYANYNPITGEQGQISEPEHVMSMSSGGNPIIDLSKDWVLAPSLSLGKKYGVRCWLRDFAGNWSEPINWEFTVDDKVKPTISIDFQSVSQSGREISGNLSTTTGVSGVDILQYLITEGSVQGRVVRDWTSDNITVTWGQNGQATFSILRLNLEANKDYYVSMKVKNKAGTWSEPALSVCRWNVVAPVIEKIDCDLYQHPYGSNNHVISGEIQHNIGSSGIISLLYIITEDSPSGRIVRDWTNENVGFVYTINQTTMSFYIGNLNLGSNKRYYLTVKIQNVAGVWSEPKSAMYIIDTTVPSIPVVSDSGNYTSDTSSLSVSWQSQDPDSGISHYSYKIVEFDHPVSDPSVGGRAITRRVLWDGTTSEWIGVYPSLGGTYVISITLTLGKTYYIVVRAYNRNYFSSIGYSDGITVGTEDTKSPRGTVTINDGAIVTNNPYSATLNFTIWDNVSSPDKIKKRLGSNGWWPTPEVWTDYVNSSIVTLDSEREGEQTISVRFKDEAGNISEASDTIIVDTIVPRTTVLNVDSNTSFDFSKTYSDTVRIAFDISDANKDLGLWTYFAIDNRAKKDFIPYGPGNKLPIPANCTLRFYTKDRAGNEEPIQTKEIKINRSLPPAVKNKTSNPVTIRPDGGILFQAEVSSQESNIQSVSLILERTTPSGERITHNYAMNYNSVSGFYRTILYKSSPAKLLNVSYKIVATDTSGQIQETVMINVGDI